MFRSRSVARHIARGVAGFGFLAVALHYASVLGWWTLAPAACALVCLRGCPMCWTLGLLETVMDRQTEIVCMNGSCTRVKPGS